MRRRRRFSGDLTAQMALEALRGHLMSTYPFFWGRPESILWRSGRKCDPAISVVNSGRRPKGSK